jgi:hypothetical protein
MSSCGCSGRGTICGCSARGKTESEATRRGGRTGSAMLSLAYGAARASTPSRATGKFLRLIQLVKAQADREIHQSLGRRTLDQFESVLEYASPALARAGVRTARCLFRDRRTRQFIKLLPVIVHRTLIAIARRISQGKDVTPKAAVRMLAQQAQTCLSRGCIEARAMREDEVEVSGPSGCAQECERKFQACLNPSWWQFWKTPNPTQCLAERQVCLQGCQTVTPSGCGEGICEGPGCDACCQFHCPNNLSECRRLCSPYR